jgi:hypothetical protein
MSNDELVETIRKKFERVSTVLDERGRRVWALAEAEALGYGGQSIVAKATGLSRMTLYSDKCGHAQDDPAGSRRHVRKAGGGRKKLIRARADIALGAGTIGGTDHPGRP